METIQIVDENGNTDEQYVWYTVDGSYGMVEEPGWYDGDYNLVDKTFDSGRAILFSNDNGDYSLQFAGQVEFETKQFECDAGFTSVGNCTPVTKNIQQYIPSGDNVFGEGLETIQVIDENGNTDEQYVWYTEDGSYGMVEEPGWYDGDYNLVGKTFEQGQAFLYSNDNGESVIEIPGTNDVLED